MRAGLSSIALVCCGTAWAGSTEVEICLRASSLLYSENLTVTEVRDRTDLAAEPGHHGSDQDWASWWYPPEVWLTYALGNGTHRWSSCTFSPKMKLVEICPNGECMDSSDMPFRRIMKLLERDG